MGAAANRESPASPAPRVAEESERGLVAALVPCHRAPPERSLLDELRKHVGKVLVVGDGLPEAAAHELRRIAAETDAACLCLPANAGKGHAIAAGLEYLLAARPRPEAVVLLDSDGQHPPERIPDFLAAAADAELVVGDRFGDLGSMPYERRAANRIASRLLSLVTGKPVRDSQCGMRLLRGRALEIPVPPGRFEAETAHLKRCLRSDLAVAWVPIPTIYQGQPSSFRQVRDTARVLLALLR